LDGSGFPCLRTFERRLRAEVPLDAIFMARHGESAWNRRYAGYIERDLTGIDPGEVYVLDHHQIDVAVRVPGAPLLAQFDRAHKMKSNAKVKVAFPWLSAALDFRTGLVVGWSLHIEPPNSDHVFQSMQHSVTGYGAPESVYLDNGKDYRSKDFSGGKSRNHRVEFGEVQSNTLLFALGTKAIFATPYRAQAKLIERHFRRIKDMFSRFADGYRGGGVNERPERLAGEIAKGHVYEWPEFVSLIERFIIDVMNRTPMRGHLNGRSPMQAWQEFSKDARYKPRRFTEEDLAILCTRIGPAKKVGRNGYSDPQVGSYWNEKLAGMRGERVYLRRDPRRWQIGYVFREADDKFVCVAELVDRVPGNAKTDLDRAHLREAIKAQRRDRKAKKAAALSDVEVTLPEYIDLQARANHAIAPIECEEDVCGGIARSWATDVKDEIRRDEIAMHQAVNADLSKIMPPEVPKKRYFLYETEREDYYRELENGG
jgi:hypothetical protein